MPPASVIVRSGNRVIAEQSQVIKTNINRSHSWVRTYTSISKRIDTNNVRFILSQHSKAMRRSTAACSQLKRGCTIFRSSTWYGLCCEMYQGYRGGLLYLQCKQEILCHRKSINDTYLHRTDGALRRRSKEESDTATILTKFDFTTDEGKEQQLNPSREKN